MNNVEILTAARDLLTDPAKWMKGDFTNKTRSCFCGLGAVAQVQGFYSEGSSLTMSEVLESKAANSLREAAIDLSPDHDKSHTFAPYNDAPERTHAEVINAFNLAIDKAKAE